LLVDPSRADAAAMARELDRRTGLKPHEVSAVFVTHEHGDHFAGLAHFPEAKWWAAPAVAEVLNESAKLPRRIEGVMGRLFDAVEVIATPGHTRTHHSLRFDCDGLSIVAAGDAVATRDFFRERRGYFNAVDFELSARTMDKLAAVADIIIPGHDNYFLADL
jgi:glyoxylase-like metal-dependent hydrolase (beta-lactamase superfamily II)